MSASLKSLFAAIFGSAPEPPAPSSEDCAAAIASNNAVVDDCFKSLAEETARLNEQEALAQEAIDSGDESKARSILQCIARIKTVMQALYDSIEQLKDDGEKLRLEQICRNTFKKHSQNQQILTSVSSDMRMSEVEAVQHKTSRNAHIQDAMYNSVMGRRKADNERNERIEKELKRLKDERNTGRRLNDAGQPPAGITGLHERYGFEERMQRLQRPERPERPERRPSEQ